VLAGVGVRPGWRAATGVVPFAGDGADRGRRRDPSPSAAPAAKGLASCRLFYARAGDISATGDVARMSCRPTHNDGCGCWWSRTMRPLPDGSPDVGSLRVRADTRRHHDHYRRNQQPAATILACQPTDPALAAGAELPPRPR
jgi:hypothetical protein